MTMRCETCGGSLRRDGNYYICESCRNKWEIDSSNDVHAVERANAWAALRDGDFEKAAACFEEIIVKEPKNYEAYWGRAFALAGIVYVDDLSENRKVPSCNNITEDSFKDSKDVQKAISLAPADIAEAYKMQAEYIDKVRVEWLEKASKEPAYDVFISFKDSDRENGIERTQDSYDAQELYTALVDAGYKVFFSRVSLREKVAEQYEPYIYNAIKTAKVMIVFGEKVQYFSSAWIKNEWGRFKTRIEKGEKHKNSLVVVYKNIDVGELPVVLKSRQCMNYADITFLSDLMRHIKRVVDESSKNMRLDKIEIAGGKISKKASALTVNAVKTREVGAGAIAETSISEKQSVSLIYTYLGEKQWQDAMNIIDDVLFNNPTCAEAIWCKLLASHQCERDSVIVKKIDNFKANDYAFVEKVLNCASKEFAKMILSLLYGAESCVTDGTYKSVLNVILPYSFDERTSRIHAAFDGVISRCKFESFKLLLTTLESSEVDKYVALNHEYVTHASVAAEKNECLNNILSVDEGNVEALRAVVILDLVTGKSNKMVIKDLESLLRYAPNADKEVEICLNWLQNNLTSAEHCDYAKQLIRYYSGDISTLTTVLTALSYRIIGQRLFEEAEYFLKLVLSFDPNNADAYWAICLMKVGAATENEVSTNANFLKDIPEFNKYLALVGDARRRQCIAISKAQTEYQINLDNQRKAAQAAHERELNITKIRTRIRDLKTKADSLNVDFDKGRSWMPTLITGLPLFIFICILTALVRSDDTMFIIIFLYVILMLVMVIHQLRKPSYDAILKNIKIKEELQKEICELESKLPHYWR